MLDSNPIPDDGNFFWFFNGRRLLDGQDGAILGVNFIQFRSLSRVNVGSYRVMSSNTAGSGDFSFQLRVNCKSVFFPGFHYHINLPHYIVVEGAPFYSGDRMFSAVEGSENYTIRLTLSADPLPVDGSFSWFFNGRRLVDREDGIYFGLNTIQFRTLTRNNSGTYRIMSSNPRGPGEFIFQITVNCKWLAL